MSKIEADYEICDGLGMCEATAPEFFEVDDDGKVKVLQQDPQGADLDDVIAAVDACPVNALRLLVQEPSGGAR